MLDCQPTRQGASKFTTSTVEFTLLGLHPILLTYQTAAGAGALDLVGLS